MITNIGLRVEKKEKGSIHISYWTFYVILGFLASFKNSMFHK